MVRPAKTLPDVPRNDATEATKKVNQKYREELPFHDKIDYINANKGLLRREGKVTILDEKGEPVWDLEEYKDFIAHQPCPETVNPSLWRSSQLCLTNGLFEVKKGFYQVRGYDISNMSYVRGETGWIILDTLLSKETAIAAHELVKQEFGDLPIHAVIYSHSHIDHFGGVKGVIKQEDVYPDGNTRVIAPKGFTEAAISENVIAGNAMARRATYMYGALLDRDAKGGVGSGLGMTNSTGEGTLILPTDIISHTGQRLTIDGVEMVFQFTPGTEAPAEMNTWFPNDNVLWMAENAVNTMHNILTLRGAQVRDALIWAKFLNQTIDMWGHQAEYKFSAHHWPIWHNSQIMDYMIKQRDVYKYIHDQAVRLMNMGYTSEEISERVSLPESLNKNWPTRGYYGTLIHNTRAVYQKYMGWYSGNPSDLNNLPPVNAAKKYIEYMGGENAVYRKAQEDFDAGNYRWVVEVLKHVAFSHPEPQLPPRTNKALMLLADAYEQLGYQAEAGTWRSVYLQAAYELRNGVPKSGGYESASADILSNMTEEMLFDYLGVRVNPEVAADKSFTINVTVTERSNIDFSEVDVDGLPNLGGYTLSIGNSVLNYSRKQIVSPDASMELPHSVLVDVLLGNLTLEEAASQPGVIVVDPSSVIPEFLGMLDSPEFWFNIVTP